MMESLKNKLIKEEARELCCTMFGDGFVLSRKHIENLKNRGYIKQDPVEKAEEIFNRINIEFETEFIYRLRQHEIDEIIKSHEYLKKQLVEK